MNCHFVGLWCCIHLTSQGWLLFTITGLQQVPPLREDLGQVWVLRRVEGACWRLDRALSPSEVPASFSLSTDNYKHHRVIIIVTLHYYHVCHKKFNDMLLPGHRPTRHYVRVVHQVPGQVPRGVHVSCFQFHSESWFHSYSESHFDSYSESHFDFSFCE